MDVSAATSIGRDERGVTLVELLVGMSMGLVVLGAAALVFTAGVKNQVRADSEAAAVAQARTTMERLIRELRQGSGVAAGTTPSSSQLSFITYVPSACNGDPSTASTQCRVTYSCAGGICTRRLAMPDGSSPGATVEVASGLSSNSVFSYSPSATSPSLVTVTLTYPAQGGGNAITLSDGAAFRNKAT
jgi:Tfp pilus assembly protein PilW